MFFKAQVASSRLFSTARGKRLYLVFRSADRDELGIWLTPDQLQADDLRMGDVVFLKRNHRGCSQLIFDPLPCEIQLKLFSSFNACRKRRLKKKTSDPLDYF